MAGHSKWANIKHKKERADQKKGKVFSKITKEIINAVKQGGPDPEANAKLRAVILKAKAANLPNENIERNIKKASTEDLANYYDITYELYGHGGVGIIVEAMTDNKNRTASDMRIATNKCGGNIATQGAVSYNFEKKGIIQIAKQNLQEDDLFLAATEAGAEDFEGEEEEFIITTASDDLFNVKQSLEEKGYTCSEASLEMIPKTTVKCSEEDKKNNLTLIEWLEGLDDVDEVFHNMEL
ncbi:MAG: YebC/PmpR family DNA-binding transcriptional regulator [Chlamydiae bacterium CG10_big_fil_rev_8_21_14_0_10_35_9]|nr:MAG: YebC/PmpR family DNA-binding transcriptional regulator [Chlamydiae bacterium CG10_big_fil_rev_8_21_14_0_10_35_9]